MSEVVPYIGTWIETIMLRYHLQLQWVVPYIGTWIETLLRILRIYLRSSYLI